MSGSGLTRRDRRRSRDDERRLTCSPHDEPDGFAANIPKLPELLRVELLAPVRQHGLLLLE